MKIFKIDVNLLQNASLINISNDSTGTNGGVSWAGLLVSFLGGLVIGLADYVTILYTVDSVILQNAAPQWPVIIAGGIGGFLGSVVDSIIGATLQYSGIHRRYMDG